MKIFLQLLLAVFFNYTAAQSPDTLWTKLYGVGTNEQSGSVIQTSEGGYAVLGSTQHFSDGDFDIWLIKTNADGDTIWTKPYGGTLNETGYSIQQTTDEGFIFLGSTRSYGAGEQDVWLIKTDGDGDTLWTKTFGGSENDVCFSLVVKDDGYVLAGYTTSFGPNGFNLWLIKTDLNGDTLWTKIYGGSGNDRAQFLQETSDGGFIITGYTTSYGNGLTDVWLIRTNEQGDTLWTKTFGGIGSEEGNSVHQTTDGGFIISCHTNSFGAGGYDAWLIKTDENGDTLWTKTYGGGANDVALAVNLTTDGYIITGYTHSTGEGLADLWLIRTDENGDTLWTKTLGGEESEEGNSVIVNSNGEYIILGEVRSFGAGAADIWLIKVASDVTSVNEIPGLTVKDFKLNQNYPNPFNPTTKISWQSSVSSWQTLKVYDVLGNEVASLVDEYKPAGSYEVEFNAVGLSSGIYFYQLQTDNLVETKKMILLQ